MITHVSFVPLSLLVALLILPLHGVQADKSQTMRTISRALRSQ